MDEFLKISYLLSPLLAGLAYHGLCIKFGWLPYLSRPIDAGTTLRGRPLFGANKTYRGVVAVALGTAAGVALQGLFYHVRGIRNLELLNYSNPAALGFGLAMGAAAMLSELPNSLLKRQLGITPGAAGRAVVRLGFYVLTATVEPQRKRYESTEMDNTIINSGVVFFIANLLVFGMGISSRV